MSWQWSSLVIITISEDLSYPLPSMALYIPSSSCTALAVAFEIQEYRPLFTWLEVNPGNSFPKSLISFWSIYFRQLVKLANKARDLVRIQYMNLDCQLSNFLAIFSLKATGLHKTHPLNPQLNYFPGSNVKQ